VRRFAWGVIFGACAYPLGLLIGEELGRRNGRSNDYAFGVKG
jgi:hypothetical protein